MPYRVKEWQRLQHFKDRRPPWIKLYRDLLDDLHWHELDPAAAKALVMIWLIASEDDGYLPDIKTLAFRLRVPEKSMKSTVSALAHWLEQDDIDLISERYQCDTPETERETEVERETEKTARVARVNGYQFDFSSWPSLPDHQILDDWMKMRKRRKEDVSQTVIDRFGKQLHIAIDGGFTVNDCMAECVTRGWRGFNADWMKPSARRDEPDYSSVK